MSYKGVDVSEHNGDINWNIAKQQIDFAILRLGWIGNKSNHTIDKKFEINYSECKRLGIPVGVYVYCYCNTTETAKSGANWTLEKLKGKSLELPVYIDMEDSSITNLGKNKLTEIVTEFNTIIEKSNYWAGVYANKNWFDNYLNKDKVKARFTTWIAHYGINQDTYNGFYDMLQYSESGVVSGIGGKVDINIMYRDLINDESNKSFPDLRYKAHIQDVGWTDWQDAGMVEGTIGESKRIEAIILEANNGLNLQYRAHVQNEGWQDWKKSGEICGTTGQSKRLEALEIKCNKVLKVEEHIQEVGWMPVSVGKEIHIGTVGKSLRIEAFRIIVKSDTNVL